MSELIEIPIREHWQFVKKGLLIVKKTCSAPWRVEDIYAECLYGKARIFRGSDDDGFVVLKPVKNKYNGDNELLVLVAYSENGIDLRKKYLPALDRIALSIGSDVLTMGSPRKGFEKDDDWQIGTIMYFRRLDKNVIK